MVVKEADINSKDASELIEALSLELEILTGNSGRGSFNKEEMCRNKKSVYKEGL